MKSSTQDRATGTFHQFTGKLKSLFGRLTGNRKLEAEGRTENAEGKFQDKVGQIKKVVGK